MAALTVTQADIDAGMASIQKMVDDKVPWYERGAITPELETQLVTQLLNDVFAARIAAEPQAEGEGT